MSQRPPPQVYSKITALLPVICKTLLLWFMNHIHQFPHDTLLPLHTASLNRFKWIILGVWIVLSLSAVHKTVVPQTHSCQKYNTDDTHISHHTLQTAERTAAQDTVEMCQTNQAKWAVTQQCMQGKKHHRDTSSVQFDTVCWSLSIKMS